MIHLFCCDREVISSSGLFRLSTFVAVVVIGVIGRDPICKRKLYNGSISNPNNRGPESLVECFWPIF